MLRIKEAILRQHYKNIYFKDCPKAGSGRSSLTLAFGKNDYALHEAVRHLSSDAVRNALGHQSFAALKEQAQVEGKSVNALCLSILRSHLSPGRGSSQGWLPGLRPEDPFEIDPIQATFKGGRHEPLHTWYPWLEGYSPAFVESVIKRHCPNATSFFDPFSGTGTTPLTAARLGRKAYFSELNPLLQFLTEAKITALKLTKDERAALATALADLAAGLDQLISASSPDEELRVTHQATFRESVFFDAEAFADILRCRSAIDQVKRNAPLTARFLTVAALRALIPASRLIRRGDLRFKTDRELARGQSNFRDEVREALHLISNDLQSISQISSAPIQVLENAKSLDRLPPLGVDAVVTSPPYLNGTNYFRNTKLELWFLRRLISRKGLARLRFTSITAGINDVTVGKPIGDLPPSTPDVVDQLERIAYDARIPRMVACFASEMHSLFQSLAKHVSKRGVIIVDIGDSAYAGVHVPTDTFITESLEAAGFHASDQIVLRRRYSRGQMKLTQKLLVFSSQARRQSVTAQAAECGWSEKWGTFKRTLPHQSGEFAKRNWGHPRHSLCSYQGKMKPSLAAHLVRTFTTPGNRMLDPFCGVGTIPFEAGLAGVKSCGFDVSSAAIHITRGKVGSCSAKEAQDTVDDLSEFLENNNVSPHERSAASAIRFNGSLPSYFHERTLDEVLLARRYFELAPPRKSLTVIRLGEFAAYPARQSPLCPQQTIASYHAVCA